MTFNDDLPVFEKYAEPQLKGKSKSSRSNGSAEEKSGCERKNSFIQTLFCQSLMNRNPDRVLLTQVCLWVIPVTWQRARDHPDEKARLQSDWCYRGVFKDTEELTAAVDGDVKEFVMQFVPLNIVPISSPRQAFIRNRDPAKYFIMHLVLLKKSGFSHSWFKVPFDQEEFFGPCLPELPEIAPDFLFAREKCSRCNKKLALNSVSCPKCFWTLYCDDKCCTKHSRLHKNTCSVICRTYLL